MSNNAWMWMWVVYDHPKDYPEHYVAREWVITEEGEKTTQSTVQSTDLEVVRRHMLEMGLACLPRYAHDDSCIVEVWL